MTGLKKRFAAVSAILLLLLTIPAVALAHGGSSRVTDDAIINILQTPISPVAGETVKANYTFTDKSANRLSNLPVTFTLSKSALGDESKDQKIGVFNKKTDANGQIEFDYKFTGAGYFDTDLDFDVAGKAQSAGNLIQVRDKPIAKNLFIGVAAADLIVGLGLGLIISKRKS